MWCCFKMEYFVEYLRTYKKSFSVAMSVLPFWEHFWNFHSLFLESCQHFVWLLLVRISECAANFNVWIIPNVWVVNVETEMRP
jgi:hypothetical protein